MTPAEFYTEVVLWIRDRWAGTGAWSDERAGAIAADFEHVPIEVAHAALISLFKDGYQLAPSPSKVMERIREHATQRGINLNGDYNPCDDDLHTWGILADLPDGRREVICSRCRTERILNKHEALTESETNKEDTDGIRIA